LPKPLGRGDLEVPASGASQLRGPFSILSDLPNRIDERVCIAGGYEDRVAERR